MIETNIPQQCDLSEVKVYLVTRGILPGRYYTL